MLRTIKISEILEIVNAMTIYNMLLERLELKEYCEQI